MKTRLVSAILGVALILALAVPPLTAEAAVEIAKPSVSASAAIIMDYGSGEILYEKDADTLRVPASMTKIMTTYIVYQELAAGNITRDTQFTISDYARKISRDGTYPQAVLLVGETISVGKMLELIMIPSACGACVVAAENIAGTEADFVQRMNDTAKALGMNAAYENSHGGRPHYITARSIAILIRQFITEFPEILELTSQKSMTYNGVTYNNTNKLLSGTYAYQGADGFKTGTIAQSGACLAGTALRDGKRLITVVMNSSTSNNRYVDTTKLLNYGFSLTKLMDALEKVKVTLSSDTPLRVGVPVGVQATFSNVTVPFKGSFTLSLDGRAIKTFQTTIDEWSSLPATVTLDESYLGRQSMELKLTFQKPDLSTAAYTKQLEISQKPAPIYRDVAFHPAEEDIERMAALGVFKSGDLFLPDARVTRAEFAALAAHMAGVDLTAGSGDHWAGDELAALAALDALPWRGGDIQPDRLITRDEAMAILVRLLTLRGDAPEYDEEKPGKARAALEQLADSWALGGFGAAFQPQETVTRAGSVTLLLAALAE